MGLKNINRKIAKKMLKGSHKNSQFCCERNTQYSNIAILFAYRRANIPKDEQYSVQQGRTVARSFNLSKVGGRIGGTALIDNSPFLPGEPRGPRRLAGYSPWGRRV